MFGLAARRVRSLLNFYIVLSFVLFAVACGAASSKIAPTLTPDIEAIVQARIEQTKAALPTPTVDVEAAVQARIEQTIAALPTPTPTLKPTATP